ncbi:sensor histidine kinase [Saliterribacillus persicus]|uniref:histidine kinase n=1 Tax=Saliterribacillus persicus TaxID=930114 RepID=A0A368Y034_9BACI|nr:HAMP domain-containing sensor histidine kinase [Saliterribacillus persicus]RCW73059.1 signal transduction histidine kinase [Saliterribacillus persicus]
MKLQYQLTIAFTTLLVIIMTVAGILVYSMMMDMLIKDEKRQLEDKGELIVNFILYEDLNNTANVQRLMQLLEEYNLQVFAYDDRSDSLLFSSIANVDIVEGWITRYDFEEEEQPLWQGYEERYVVSIIPLYTPVSTQHLVLLTPLQDLQAVQQSLLGRMVLIFLIGIGVAVALSHYLTKRLVTPLTKLKYQLKKIEKRKFDEMEDIEATGEIKEVERSVAEMATELKTYIQSQRQFFQNASHELKTPLMTIQGYAEGIRDGVFEGAEEQRGLNVMVKEIGRLKKIINEMILLAKLDSEENIYHLRRINLAELVKQTEERALPIANEKGVSLHIKAPENHFIYGDQDKILQAMMNIVTNGIRHAKTQMLISVVDKGQFYAVDIEDDGPGIEKELMEKLFHRFVKGKDGETGLGLAISRAIVERSEGTIRLDESTLGGAKFILEFPKTK